MSNTAKRVDITPPKMCHNPLQHSPVGIHSCFEFLCELDDCTRKKNNTYIGHFTLYSFYTVRDISSMWKIHTQPQGASYTPVTGTHLQHLKLKTRVNTNRRIAGDFGTLLGGVTHMLSCVAHSMNARY